MRKPLVLIVSVSAGLAIASSARAQCDVAQRRATGNRPDVRLGRSVSIAGDAAVFGAPGDGETARFPPYARGSARVFRRQNSTWIEEATLLASDGQAGDHFGIAVAISGDTTVVGADYAPDGAGVRSGAAYIYRFDGAHWIETQKLTAPNGVENTTFGYSVAISDDTVVIGAPEVGGLGVAAGSVYVYRFDGATWVQQPRLVPSVGRLRDFFGISVALSGDTVLIGANGVAGSGIGTGAAYIFQFADARWVETDKLVAPDGAQFDSFGCSVALFGNTGLIGARGHRAMPCSRGAAYVFRRDKSGWNLETKLLGSNRTPGDNFGFSVALSGDTALVGAFQDDNNRQGQCDGAGAIHLFRFDHSGWLPIAKLTPKDAVESDNFGIAVALCGDTAMVGAKLGSGENRNCGAVYGFELSDFYAGDLNCDGAFNGDDIDLFFLALGDPAEYVARLPHCDVMLADMNGNGRLDGGDIDPFFACLGGNCP